MYSKEDYRRWRANKAKRASALRLKLLKLLGGKCAECGNRYIPVLQIDHVEGTTWYQRSANRADRQFKFWKEYQQGVPLRVLCSECNKVHVPEYVPPRSDKPEEEEVPF